MDQRLIFVRLTGDKTADGHLLAEYRCRCGGSAVVARSRVKNGYTRSCGCLTADTKPGLTHGQRGSRTYSSWTAMKQRCCNPENKDYPRWGGVGVTVCDRWQSFENFLADMGERPKGTTIDRIDATGNYEPGNCRWATSQQQQRNRRSSVNWHIKGRVFPTLREAAAHFGVTEQSVRRWVVGQHDHRRNSFTPPLEDCHARARY